MKKRCPYCGDEFETTNARKIFCNEQHRSLYHASKNREHKREYARAYWQANREKILATQKEYNQKRRKRNRSYQKRYAQKNRDRILAQRAAFRQENRDRLREEKRKWWASLDEEQKQYYIAQINYGRRLRRARTKSEISEEQAALEMIEDAFIIEQLIAQAGERHG